MLLTYGHGTEAPGRTVEILTAGAVQLVVDGRSRPSSRRHPQFGMLQLKQWLPEAGIAYRWEQRLGGFRDCPPGSTDAGLRNDSFRGYAAHTRTPAYNAAIDQVLAESRELVVAVMCAESLWWHCHRMIIADHVQVIRDVAVRHLMHDGRITPHKPITSPWNEDGHLVYDHGQPALTGWHEATSNPHRGTR